MTVVQPLFDPSHVPDACTLPTTEQPLRVAEFDRLFRLVTEIDRPEPTRLQMTLLPAEPAVAAHAAELAAREARCCGFFTFTLTVRQSELKITIETPAAHVDVLDALADRVAAASTR